jgi:hypothetical protein
MNKIHIEDQKTSQSPPCGNEIISVFLAGSTVIVATKHTVYALGEDRVFRPLGFGW